ncbi:MAG: lactonase family protein [Planctomycetaceae bacterium]|nr:lactonase family protein [Planctomycetaceae bacterium]
MQDNTFVFAANAESNDIASLRLLGDGRLELQTVLPVDASASALAVHPDGRTLYVALANPPQIASLAVSSRTGQMQVLSVVPAPAKLSYITTDRAGRFLLGASYSGDIACSLPISPLGLVQGHPAAVLRPGRNPHCIVVDHANRFVYIPCLGSDQVGIYRFDAATGEFAPAAAPVVLTAREAGPRHLAISPDNRFAHLVCELNGDVVTHVLDPVTGGLSAKEAVSLLHPTRPLPPSSYTPPTNEPAGENSPEPVAWAADISLTPDGRFLYASERTHSTLTCFAVDVVSGRLDYAGIFETEQRPRNFAIDPKGGFLVAAGEKSHHFAAYRIDRDTGGLSPCGRVEVGRKPVWVEIGNYR